MDKIYLDCRAALEDPGGMDLRRPAQAFIRVRTTSPRVSPPPTLPGKMT